MNLFSFHTIEFKQKICTQDYSDLFKLLLHHNSRFYRSTDDENIWYSGIFDSLGIRLYLKHIDGIYPYSEVKLIINPRHTLGDRDYVGIFDPTSNNIDDFLKVMNDCLKKINLDKFTEYRKGMNIKKNNSMENFKLSRCDLCYNHHFQSQDYADVYLKLMKRGRLYECLNNDTTYSETSKRQVKYDDALVLCAKSFDISIYSKKAQMADNISFFKEIPASADGLIRFEIKIGRDKIKYLKKKNQCSTHFDFLALVSQITYSEIKRYVKGLFLQGDYYQLRDAKELIKKYDPDHANELIMFIQRVSKERSLDTVLQEDNLTDIPNEVILRRLNKLRINPVTLPEEDAKVLSCRYLTSIPDMLGY